MNAKLACATVAVAVLSLLSVFPASAATNAAKYHHEHQSRLRRHAALTPAQRHARALKYRAEHKARMHRHRAHLKNKRHHG